MVLTNVRHERFAVEVANGVMPRDAVVRAGYGAGKAAETAWRLMLYPRVTERIQELRQELQQPPAITVKASLLRELGRQCRATSVSDEAGRLIGFFIPVQASVSGVGA